MNWQRKGKKKMRWQRKNEGFLGNLPDFSYICSIIAEHLKQCEEAENAKVRDLKRSDEAGETIPKRIDFGKKRGIGSAKLLLHHLATSNEDISLQLLRTNVAEGLQICGFITWRQVMKQ